MRVNVYAEEMTNRVEIIGKEINGHRFTGLRFYLELPATVPNGGGVGYQEHTGPFLHGATKCHCSSSQECPHRPFDDDSAAVTFWGKSDLRTVLRKALAMLDNHYAKRAETSGETPRQSARELRRFEETMSEPTLRCNACGREVPVRAALGSKFKVCSGECCSEMNWRHTLSIMGKPYTPSPESVAWAKRVLGE